MTPDFDLIYWQPPGTTWAKFLDWLKGHAGHELVVANVDMKPPGSINRLLIHCLECRSDKDIEITDELAGMARRAMRALNDDTAPW